MTQYNNIIAVIELVIFQKKIEKIFQKYYLVLIKYLLAIFVFIMMIIK